MKKLLALVLSVTLIFSLAVTVWAVNLSKDSTEFHQNVTVTSSIADSDSVYSVDITWGSLAFTYTISGRTWNPTDHSYTEQSGDGLFSCNNGDDSIIVTNHSNAQIGCSFEYVQDNNYSNVIGEFSDNSDFTLASADGTSYSNAPTKTTTLTLSGSLDEEVTNANVGQVYITITK